MLPVRMFADRRITSASLASAALGFTAFTLLTFLPTFLQNVQHYSPALTGVLLLPWATGTMIAAYIGGRWTARHGARAPMTTGLVFVGVSMFALLAADPTVGYRYLGTLFGTFGIGIGLTVIPSQVAVMSTVNEVRANTAAAVVNAIQKAGSLLGIALLGILFYEPDLTEGLKKVALVAGIVAFVVALLAVTTRIPTSTTRQKVLAG